MDDRHKTQVSQLFTENDKPSQLRGVLDQVKMIATGGMAQIFRARQPSLDRYVVVKRLKDELLSHQETLERFRREAKALASVLHQNVAHVYDFVESGGESFLLMEYIEGMDLSTIIQKMGSLPPDIAAAVLLNVVKGVSYIHAHHLIHRDIKPGNIRINTRGEVKLMDFGIVMDIENQALTRPGMMVGSPSYLSPEQVLGDPISPKADMFLVGITFYEMLTGVRPFKDEAGETVFQRIREAKYIPVREMNSAVPKALDRIVRRCLHKRPEARFADMKELIYELEKFLGGKKSAHTEDLLLKYLDNEALLSPTVPYSEIGAGRMWWRELLDWRVLLFAFLSAAAAFTAGYFLGSGDETKHSDRPSGYQSPKTLK
jgi:eukaryotic-like serine/threonine-protein kinase